jgi:uncharacterized SAM-binding protein YcdF (DUF218 family)
MFFILSKTLHLLLAPFLWVLLLLFLAIFLKNAKWKRMSLITAVIILLILSNPFLANEAWRAWEVKPVPVHVIEDYDAAVILTGITGSSKDMPDRVLTHKGADRFLHPLQLYRMGKINKFIISGGSSRVLTKLEAEAKQVEKILLMAGVPKQAIITEGNSRNTRENAANTANLLKQHPDLNKLLLVTSAFHMRRAMACFDKANVGVTPFTTDFYSSERRFTPDDLFIPSVSALSGWQLLLHEISGFLIYKILGYC